MPDLGVVCQGEHEGRKTLGIRLNFSKRYITLAPIATVVGLAFKLRDPEGLLGDKSKSEYGITCALIPAKHPGVLIGRRHYPGAAFMNGTVTGEDVWVPMSNILGGQQRCGFGWHMFVECLAEGRGVSLPAGALGAARTVCAGVGAYSRVRKQFRVPIAEFGGIQEALARAGRESYIVLAGTELTNAIIDNHEAPMVLSSIMKQSCTERGRRIITDGMDILGGAGISQGKANFVGSAYMSMPVAITVEGANIMTRSFQIIGQGLTRCHPHMLPAINALQSKEPDAPAKFRTHLFKVLGHVFSNWGLSLTRGIGASISEVQAQFSSMFGAPEPETGGAVFDHLFNDGEVFHIGKIEARVMHTPGHTPACVTYVVGDTLFMPDYGTARADFPGGDAATLYRSIQRILALPPETRIFVGHDYLPAGRDKPVWQTTVAEQRASNIHIGDGVTEEDFVRMRTARDKTLAAPRLILPSLQVNIRGGALPKAESDGRVYLRTPVVAV
jgi:hypothetical protein